MRSQCLWIGSPFCFSIFNPFLDPIGSLMRLLWRRAARCTHSQLNPAPLKASLLFRNLPKWKAHAALPLLFLHTVLWFMLLCACVLLQQWSGTCLGISYTSGRLKKTFVRWHVRAETCLSALRTSAPVLMQLCLHSQCCINLNNCSHMEPYLFMSPESVWHTFHYVCWVFYEALEHCDLAQKMQRKYNCLDH